MKPSPKPLKHPPGGLLSLARRVCAFLGLLLAVGLSGLAQANQDDPGSADHPSVPRFPGFYIDDFKANDFNAFEFITGMNPRTGEQTKVSKEGRYLQNTYFLKDGARRPSVIEIIRNYENAFRKAGGSLVWSDTTEGLATYRQRDDKGERWVSFEINTRADWMRITVVDVSAMEQKVEVSAGQMLDALNRDGFIALNGILFDTGKDTIKAESNDQLQEVVALLSGNPSLRLSIEGHTDNVGASPANVALSKRRAESVKAWLVGKGVSASRLQTQGFGDTKPVADNRTEDGRAKNRRVELVKLK